MIELERTFLAKKIPDLTGCKSKEIIDIYIPKASNHPTLRIRKNGDTFEMTKKEPVKDDPSHQLEQTIMLREEEFNELSKLDGMSSHKIRYYYDYKGIVAEITVFQKALKGLVLVDVEFDSKEQKEAFEIPDFCLADVTHEYFAAGGTLAGKSYEDISDELKKFGYSKINIS
ncbi:hypothetical protein CL614_04440 [archaeon]|nr:hypothetical protein [archaeon]|tara:strand:+ start:1438 stop:1953 length:516 start_codon:yes stop_codon:yes gene_type:complete